MPDIQRRKYQKVSKGGRRSPFGSGSSNRCEQQPVGMGFHRGTAFHLAHDFALQSLVCYTFCDHWRGKGAAGRGQTLFSDSRTERFCNAVIIAKLICLGGVDRENFGAARRNIRCQRRAQEVYKTRRSDIPSIVQIPAKSLSADSRPCISSCTGSPSLHRCLFTSYPNRQAE